MLNFLLQIGMLAQVDAGAEESKGDLVMTPIAPFEGSFLLPPQVTTNAASTDVPFQFTLWIGVLTFLLIMGVMLYVAIRYRRRSPDQKPEPSSSNDVILQFAWTVIPLVLFLDIFYLGFRGFMDVTNAPSNAMNISVGAQDSKWSFTYSDGHIDEVLHVPVNKPVKLTMESERFNSQFFCPRVPAQTGCPAWPADNGLVSGDSAWRVRGNVCQILRSRAFRPLVASSCPRSRGL